jgi:hypothetical protein
MRPRILIAWIVAAVLGLALAAGITLAAGQLSSQQIGLSGEPLSAGEELVPRRAPAPKAAKPGAASTPTGTQPAPRRSPRESRERGEGADGDD